MAPRFLTVAAAVVAVAALACACVGVVEARGKIQMSRKPHKFTPMPAHQLLRQTPGKHTVIMDGGVLTVGAYYTNITIGTPPVTYEVLIDTGSSNLAVALKGCQSCGPTQVYDPAASSTSHPMLCGSAACNLCSLDGSSTCLFEAPYCALNNASVCGGGISYGGSSSFISGQYFTDKVTFAGMTTDVTLLAIDGEYPATSLTGSPFQGIFGLAHEANACNPTCVGTMFNSLVQEGQVENIFGMCLDPSNGGVIDVGYIDDTKFKGDLQYVPIVKKDWYNMGMKDIKFNGISIGLPPAIYGYLNDAIGTFIDSGTSVMLFAPEIMTTIQNVWQSNFCSLPGVCGSSSIFTGQCLTASQAGNLSQFPSFELIFQGENGDVSLYVPPTSYFQQVNDQYCFVVQSTVGISAVLGDVLMENYYIVHDRANNRLGFAPVASCM